MHSEGCLLVCSLLASSPRSHRPGRHHPCSELQHSCYQVSFLYRGLHGQGCVLKSLGPRLSEISQLASTVGLVGPLAKRAGVYTCMMAGSQWQLQIEQENGPRDGAVALKGWRGEEIHREGEDIAPQGPGGPGWRRGLAEHGKRPWLFSTAALGCE